jgi:hypothetical protein
MQFYFYSNEIFSAWIFRLSYQAKKISEIHQYWPRWISNFYKFVFLKQYVDLFILFCFLAFEIVDCFMASTHQNWHLISTSFFFVLRLVMHLNTCKIFFFYFFFPYLKKSISTHIFICITQTPDNSILKNILNIERSLVLIKSVLGGTIKKKEFYLPFQ